MTPNASSVREKQSCRKTEGTIGISTNESSAFEVKHESDRQSQSALRASCRQSRRNSRDLGGDDLIVNTIIRVAKKRDRVNRLLEEKGCEYRITGIEVENSIPPKVVFSVARNDEA